MKIKKTLLMILSLLVIGSGISACGKNQEQAQTQSQEGTTSSDENNKDKSSTDDRSSLVITTETINKEEFSSKDFSDYDLTMINIMATWCQPCIEEMPELEQVYKDYKDKKVNLVGYVIDTKKDGQVDEEALNAALELQKQLNITYPMIMPDDTNLGGIGDVVQAVPTTIFVNKEGKIVGDAVAGANSSDGWKVAIDQRLELVNE